ncbi:putative adhesin-like protein [uncultured Mediterranean phage uvMED]|nr:putative adhesin-like protein [uncultured Mediterranean phage uvMED]BAQ84872.1 putative adhesin-like protein [uncultured Mediterranean phage uvMED]BAQ84900.1 putative adhesin-like protein [uncultured Mediterranean phage uvMED]BAR13767.1 putative adhesin-like protein [uncultured Mediterranean phage uvMED]BAR14876.1 putative adhesin-like protein [uncultured Mediterranean phage uvMED]
MIKKLKDNLALVVTGITLLGSIGAGFQSVTNIVNTLTGIDDRMNNIEFEFYQLKESTMVSNDIAVLYEKIYALEQIAYNAEFLENELTTLKANYQNLDNEVRDLEWKLEDFQARYISELNNPPQDSQAYELMKWEWQDLLKKITTLENNQLETWELDNLRDRVTYLEAYMHQH